MVPLTSFHRIESFLDRNGKRVVVVVKVHGNTCCLLTEKLPLNKQLSPLDLPAYLRLSDLRKETNHFWPLQSTNMHVMYGSSGCGTRNEKWTGVGTDEPPTYGIQHVHRTQPLVILLT